MEGYLDILKESLLATIFVVGMMAVVEFVNFKTEGRITSRLRNSRLAQVFAGSALGAAPGCVGGFLTVGLYSQNALSFAGVFAMSIATVGDEAFLMLAQFPTTSLYIFAGLFAFALLCGSVASLMQKQGEGRGKIEVAADRKSLRARLAHLLPHGLRIFFWVLAISLLMHCAEGHVALKEWISGNTALMIVLAVLIGWIPQSGPHIIFIEMFAAGVIPLPVLIANCIVQDGHAGIPLILHDWKDFVKVKLIKSGIALATCFAWILFL